MFYSVNRGNCAVLCMYLYYNYSKYIQIAVKAIINKLKLKS